MVAIKKVLPASSSVPLPSRYRSCPASLHFPTLGTGLGCPSPSCSFTYSPAILAMSVLLPFDHLSLLALGRLSWQVSGSSLALPPSSPGLASSAGYAQPTLFPLPAFSLVSTIKIFSILQEWSCPTFYLFSFSFSFITVFGIIMCLHPALHLHTVNSYTLLMDRCLPDYGVEFQGSCLTAKKRVGLCHESNIKHKTCPVTAGTRHPDEIVKFPL